MLDWWIVSVSVFERGEKKKGRNIFMLGKKIPKDHTDKKRILEKE